MFLIIESHFAEREFAEFAHRVRLAGGNDVVARPVTQQHQAHRAHIVGGMAPVAPGVQVAQPHLGLEPQRNAGHRARDLARHKLVAPPRALVVEQNPATGIEPVRLTVIECEIVTGHLTHAVRAAWVKGGRLALWRLAHLAEHLTGGGKVETGLGLQ